MKSPFEGLNIIIIGDAMLDEYVYGVTHRISPEAPVPVLERNHQVEKLGGAANVALNIQGLGATSHLISIIGPDDNGKRFYDLMLKHKLLTKNLLRDKERVTTVKTRIIAKQKQLLRIDQEDRSPINKSLEDSIFAVFKKTIQQESIDCIALQDYNKGVLTPRLIEAIIAYATIKSIPVVVDPKFNNIDSYAGATVIKPNLVELSHYYGKPLTSEEIIESIGEEMRSKLGTYCLFTTMSENGMQINLLDKKFHIMPYSDKIVDVCGAGDTVLASICCGVSIDLDMEEIASIANVASAYTCSIPGVAPVIWQELVKTTPEFLG